ncbi:uncharacterized protein LOC144877752 [Branchiostoma floridae x Branchiostoma japonicum]
MHDFIFLTGGWVETDPTWVTTNEWEGEDGVRRVAGYVLDNNFNTSWRGDDDADVWSLTFDLQRSMTLSRVRLWLVDPPHAGINLLVNDIITVWRQAGQRWTEVTVNKKESGSEIDLTGLLTSAQVWRLQFSKIRHVVFRKEIREIEFFQACSGFERTVCTDGACDVHVMACDGTVDCVDGSDENNCAASVCDNGALFHPATRCDGRDDCGDSSDEKNCACYYLRDKGRSYRGLANRDRTCQFWTSQYPHTHNHTPEAYPSAGLERNYCRNPDGKDRPWCYTNNPLIRWMYCEEVFACDAPPTRCFYAVDRGRSYAGQIDNHPHTPQAHPDAGLEENFCRNPDNKERPWCYTTDPIRRWDYCNVMECADPFISRCVTECSPEKCKCDNDCVFFGDCCIHYEESSIAPTPSDHHHLKWKCVPGFSLTEKVSSLRRKRELSFWMVADCPDDWTDDVTRDQCLKDADPFNPNHLVYRVPVYVEESSIRIQNISNVVPYRNIFCAICNNVSSTDVTMWDSYFQCSGLLNLSSNIPRDSEEYVNIADSGLFCFGTNKLVFLPSELSYVRECLQVDLSNENCDVDACLSYNNPIGSGQTIYRNVHCAHCEGLSLTATTHLGCASIYDASECVGDCRDCRPPQCPARISLTNLFNFNAYRNGDNSANQCPLDTLYDPFAETCRAFSSNSRSHGASNKTILLQNCSEPALTFTAEEFRVLPNGSVHLLSSNVSCPAEQVAILNTTASICGECVLQHFVNNTQIINSQDPYQGWLTLGLVIASAVAVLGYVVFRFRSGQLKKLPEQLKVQMMLCMVLAEGMFVARVWVPLGQACVVFAIFLHYFMLTAFTSMNALAMDLCLTFRDDLERIELYKYVLYTWLMPVPVVVLTVILDFTNSVKVGYGENCWIGNPTSSLVSFGVPVICALLVNAVLVTFVLLAIRRSFEIANAALARSNSSKAWVYIRISCLMGFTWILGFIYPFANSRAVEYIFIVLNASQGLLLTLIMAITSEVVQKWKAAIRARFGLAGPNQNTAVTATASNQQTTASKTGGTTGGVSSATDIPMTTFGEVKENRATLHRDEPQEGNIRTATASNVRYVAGDTEATARETHSAAQVPLASFTDVEEKSVPLQLDEPHQDSGQTTSVSDRQTIEGKTEATAVGASSAAAVALTSSVDFEENRASLQPDEPYQDSGRTTIASNIQTAGETGCVTDIPMGVVVDKEKKSVIRPTGEPHQDSEQINTASDQQSIEGKTEATAVESGAAATVP